MYLDPLYFVFALPGMLLAMWAQWHVKSTFNKYAQVPNMQRLTGFDTANRIRQAYGLQNVQTNQVPGMLTDFYNPADKTINLSQSSLQPSVAAMAVVAHELGHALQDKEGNTMMRLRSSIVGIANFGSGIAPWMIIIGLMMSGGRGGFGFTLAVAGLLLFGAAVLFTLVTLPVEFDASSKAKRMLAEQGMVSVEEQVAVKKVLSAAAWTYVASSATAVLQFLYFALRVFGSRRD